MKVLTFEEFAAEQAPFHNHICILYDMTLVRLIGVEETPMDRHYIVREIGSKGQYCASAVGRCYSLKGVIPDERYDAMDSLFAMNKAGPTTTFSVEMLDNEEEDY